MLPIEKSMRIKETKFEWLANKLTEILIFFIIIFSPWAFGATESWSIWTINITSYILGVLLITKWAIQHFKKCNSFREKKEIALSPEEKRQKYYKSCCNIFLTIGMLILLLYILISAINARASFDPKHNEYSYFAIFSSNLPHSFDAKATWFIPSATQQGAAPPRRPSRPPASRRPAPRRARPRASPSSA